MNFLRLKNYLVILITLLLSSLTLANEITPMYQPLAKSLTAKAGTQLVTANFLVKIPIVNDTATIQWLDRDNLIYSTSKDNSASFEIGAINLSGNTAKIIGSGSLPKASPNGKYIAYIKDNINGKQLYLVDRNGTNGRQLTQIKNGLTGGAGYHYNYAWSPDSKKIVLTYQPMVEFWQQQNKKDLTKTSAIQPDALYSAPPPTTLTLFDLTSNKMTTLTNIDASIRYISWFQNKEKLIFLKEREALTYHQKEDETFIATFDIAAKQTNNLAKIPGLQQMLFPVMSPDDSQVAYLYDEKSPSFAATPNLWIQSMRDKKEQESSLAHAITRELKLIKISWHPNSKQIYALRYYGPYHQLCVVDINTRHTKQITSEPLSIENFALSPDGKNIAWIGLDAHGNRRIRTANSDGNSVQDIINFSLVPNNMALSEVREIQWQTADYPYPLRGIVVMPLNYQAGKKYPLITDIHGGGLGDSLGLDSGFWLTGPLEWQLWSAKGYMVFVPDMRSSGSYGSIAITKNEYQEHDSVNKDTLDVTAGIDSLIAKGMVDPKKIAVIGHSAGGRRVNWLAVASHRFTTLISKEGWADEWLLAGISPMKRVIALYGGMPVNVPTNYQKNSCLFHAKGASTPILFLMSSAEKGADRYGSVLWLYNAIKAQGIDTQYIQYPDEGHVIERPVNRVDSINRTISWIDRYLK